MAATRGDRPATGRKPVRAWVLLSLLAAMTAGGYYSYTAYLRWEYFEPRNFAAVEPGKLYRSGQISRHQIRSTLTNNKIGAIIFMSEDKADRPDVQAEAAAAAELGVERYNFPLAGDGTGNPDRYVDAVATIVQCQSRGKAVLVHCHTGAQRTGGAIAFYRLLVQGRTGKEVYAELNEHGHDPTDNVRMIPFLNQNMGRVARGLLDRGVIPALPATLPVIEP